MAAELVSEQRTEGVVVDVAAAVIGGAHVAQVGLEALVFAERHDVDQLRVVLLVDAVQSAVVIATGQFGHELVFAAGEHELVAGVGIPQHNISRAAIEHRHLFVVRGVTVAGAVEHAEIERQPIDLFALQPGTTVDARQQTAVVAHHHRDDRLQGADVQGRIGHLCFGGQAGGAVVVRRLTGRVSLQDTRAGAIRAGIELDAQQT